MPKFIAVRKTPRVRRLGLAAMSTADKRKGLVQDAPASERAAVLRGLGLQQIQPEERAPEVQEQTSSISADAIIRIQPEERAPEVQEGFRRLGYLGAYVVNTPDERKAEQAREVLESDYLIMPDIELSLPTPTIAASHLLRRGRQRESWPAESGVATAHHSGVTGKGVLVGVLDTGVDADHIELRRKRIEFRYVPLDPAPDAMRAVRGFDTHGHGTHVCGIIAGRRVGVAPDVDLMVASVIESETMRTSLERIYAGLDWMLSQFTIEENQDKPTIVSMSLGFRPEWISPPDLQAVMDGLKLLLSILVDDFDVLPVVAIGNDGPGVMRGPGYFPEVLSVGAVDFGLNPASFSGGGTSPLTGGTEPDVAGYGVDVFSSLERDADNRSSYARMSGTSMATPYVAGVAALLASANPRLQGNALRQRILSQALPLGYPPDRVGAGLARFM